MNDNDILGLRPEWKMNTYSIYEHPADYPDDFVVRRWENTDPKELVGTAKTLEAARKYVPHGMVNVGRYAQDDPCIVEVWI